MISGTLSMDGTPSANVELRLYASYPECEGVYIQSKTDSNGSFLFRTESTKGGISEVTQLIALCVEKDGSWRPLWAPIIGGGASSIKMTCKPEKRDDPFDKFCTLDVDYSN